MLQKSRSFRFVQVDVQAKMKPHDEVELSDLWDHSEHALGCIAIRPRPPLFRCLAPLLTGPCAREEKQNAVNIRNRLVPREGQSLHDLSSPCSWVDVSGKRRGVYSHAGKISFPPLALHLSTMI